MFTNKDAEETHTSGLELEYSHIYEGGCIFSVMKMVRDIEERGVAFMRGVDVKSKTCCGE